MTETPLVSVVVATYQHGSYISACLDSILAQRVDFPVEVLVGEDGSVDGTREVCIAYAQAHPDRIKLFLRDRSEVILINGDPSGRANVLDLYRRCQGKYVAVCEGDDIWTDPDKLALQVAALEADPSLSAVVHHTELIDKEGRSLGKNFREHLPERLGMEHVLKDWSPFHLTSFLFRNLAFYRDMPRWVRRVGSFDFVMFALSANEGPILGMQRTMSAYRRHGEGFTSQGSQKRASFEFLRVLAWLEVAAHFRGRWADLLWPLMDLHYGRMLPQATRRTRLHYFRRLFMACPGMMMSRPKRCIRWAMGAWRGV